MTSKEMLQKVHDVAQNGSVQDTLTFATDYVIARLDDYWDAYAKEVASTVPENFRVPFFVKKLGEHLGAFVSAEDACSQLALLYQRVKELKAQLPTPAANESATPTT